MRSHDRIKYDMGVRALEFCHANPLDVPQFPALVKGLDEAVLSGRDFAREFGDGRSRAHASTEHRMLQRAAIHEINRHIVKIGRALAEDDAALGGYFAIGSKGQANVALLARGLQHLAKVKELQDRFTAYGFGPERTTAFEAALTEFAAGLERTAGARRSHVGARRALRAVVDRIMTLTGQLDAIHSAHYADDPKRLAEWQSATNIHWPEAKKRKEGEAA